MAKRKWLNYTDPMQMIGCLQRQMPCGRKFRLLSIACCRRIWRLLPDDRNRLAVEVAERFADKQASDTEREAAHAASYSMYANTSPPGSGFADAAHGIPRSAWEAAQAASIAALVFEDNSDAGYNAAGAVQQTWNAIEEEAKELHPDGAIADYSMRTGREQEREAQVRLIRCIFGNPFRPLTLPPTYRTPTVVSLARAAYDERQLPSGELDLHRLAVLADSLEEVGAPVEMVTHLRGPGPHVRGCFAVDLCLGLT